MSHPPRPHPRVGDGDARPARRAVRRALLGYRIDGFEPCVHHGLPSRFMTFIVSIGDSIDVLEHSDLGQRPGQLPRRARRSHHRANAHREPRTRGGRRDRADSVGLSSITRHAGTRALELHLRVRGGRGWSRRRALGTPADRQHLGRSIRSVRRHPRAAPANSCGRQRRSGALRRVGPDRASPVARSAPPTSPPTPDGAASTSPGNSGLSSEPARNHWLGWCGSNEPSTGCATRRPARSPMSRPSAAISTRPTSTATSRPLPAAAPPPCCTKTFHLSKPMRCSIPHHRRHDQLSRSVGMAHPFVQRRARRCRVPHRRVRLRNAARVTPVTTIPPWSSTAS